MPKSGKLGPDDESPIQSSYRNYAVQMQKLWDGFDKPAMIGECGWDHTYHEPGMPGYLAMYHNAIWVSLVNGACTTPFWWSYSDWINDSVVTNQMLYFSQFVSKLDFASKNFEPADITAPDCDAWAMRADKFVVGWVVHPRTSVANEPIHDIGAARTANMNSACTGPGAVGTSIRRPSSAATADSPALYRS